MLERIQTPRQRAEEIISEECAASRIKVSALRSESSHARIVAIRQRVAMRLFSEIGLSSEVIGRMLNRERTTILYYLNKDMQESKRAKRAASYYGLKAVREALA